MKKQLALALGFFMTTVFASGVSAAEFKPGFKVGTYFGQYTPAGDDAEPHFESIHEANLKLKGSEGPIEGYFEIESRNAAHNKGSDFKNTQRRIDYKMDALKFSVGTIVPKEAVGFAAKAGTPTSQTKSIGAYEGLLAKTEADGLGIRYRIAEGIDAGVTLYSVDAINKNVSGNGTQLGVLGKFGPLGFRVSTLSTEARTWDGSDASKKGSNMNIGIQYKMETLTASVDSTSQTITTAAHTQTNDDDTTTEVPEAKKETSDLALQVRVGAGPGKAIVTYATRTIKDASTENWINLVYDIPLDKHVGAQLAYLTSTNTPDEGDTKTQSFIGGGFYAKF